MQLRAVFEKQEDRLYQRNEDAQTACAGRVCALNQHAAGERSGKEKLNQEVLSNATKTAINPI